MKNVFLLIALVIIKLGFSQTVIQSFNLGLSPENHYINVPDFDETSDTSNIHIVFGQYFYDEDIILSSEDSVLFQGIVSTPFDGLGVSKHLVFPKQIKTISFIINNSSKIVIPMRKMYPYIFIDINTFKGRVDIVYSEYMKYLE